MNKIKRLFYLCIKYYYDKILGKVQSSHFKDFLRGVGRRGGLNYLFQIPNSKLS